VIRSPIPLNHVEESRSLQRRQNFNRSDVIGAMSHGAKAVYAARTLSARQDWSIIGIIYSRAWENNSQLTLKKILYLRAFLMIRIAQLSF
jgi:hypothetical protein